MCLDRSAEGLRPVPKALSDPEIKSLTKNERKTHTAAASVNERSEGSRGERERNVACVQRRERKEEEEERVWPWIETERGSACPGRPQSLHWVCVGDDVSVKYKSADRYENKSHRGPECVCIFVRYFKLPSFMNGCDMCITSSGSESNNAKTVGSDILLVAVACSPY